MEQLTLLPITVPEPCESDSIEKCFVAFHEKNPHVYRNLVIMARQLGSRGRKKIGMKMLFEPLRWNYLMATDDPNSDYKLNNNYTSRYARLISKQEPDLSAIFEVRELKAI